MNITSNAEIDAEESAETLSHNNTAFAAAQATESGGFAHNSTEVVETPAATHGLTVTTPRIGDVTVINDLSNFPLSVRELAAPQPQHRRRVPHYGPPRMVHGVPFFESWATLDSVKSSKWSVNLRVHCQYASQQPSATARMVQVGILVGEALTLVTGHIRPRTFAAFFYRVQLEELGITRGEGFLATLVEVEEGTPVIPTPVIPAQAGAIATEVDVPAVAEVPVAGIEDGNMEAELGGFAE